MKNKLFVVLALAFLSTLNSQLSTLLAQGTAFTYQGRLTDNGVPASGVVEVQCTLWDAVSGGTQVAVATPASTIVNISNGLFTVALDFGAAAFDGSDRYLQMEARTTLGPYTLLTPRQKITATPYAILAGKVASAGVIGTYGSAVTFSNLANVFNGSFTGNGGGLSNLNAASLGGLSTSNFWKTSGNAGTTAGVNFLGTTDNQPLELKANGQRVMRLASGPVTNIGPGYSAIYSNAPNVIGGAAPNQVGPGVIGATIGGGGLGGAFVDTGTGYTFAGSFSNYVAGIFGTIAGGLQNVIQTNSPYGFIGGGYQNRIGSNLIYSTIGGGYQNVISNNGTYAVVGGGSENISSAQNATVGGGDRNTSSDYWCTVAGGQLNVSSNSYATVGGGTLNIASGFASTVPGGYSNSAAGTYSFAAGYRAKALHQGAFVWGDSQNADFSSTANNQFLIRAAGGVGINTASPGSAALAVNGRVGITGGNVLELGFGVAGKEANAGSIGYQAFTADALDIVGAGSTGFNRKIKFWCEAGATFTGVITAPSDRKLKQDFQSLNTREVLDKVVAMPVQRWAYKSDAVKRHIGPVAQDFHAAFGLNGDDDTTIATVDADGVALAAIQGLNQKVEEKDAEIRNLRDRLEKLEQIFARQLNAIERK